MSIEPQRRTGTDDLAALLRELIDEVRGLRADQAQARRPSLSRVDRVALDRLLPAIAGVLGSEWFLASEAVKHPAPALRLVLQGISAKKLGRLLKRAAGQPIGGYLVTSGGTEAGVILWQVVQVANFPHL
jgi:hypothetical protein